jgi:glycosyltransferase involved in cell wall biosynthesis
MQDFLAGVSLCMIVKDEERFLADALRSVAGVVDELCIVDTGSSDRTVAIAEEFGARVTHLPWSDDFAQARNAALAMARRRWIIVLDADERLTPGSTEALRKIGQSSAHYRGYWISCRNLNDDIKGSGATSNTIVRIFPNDPRIRYRNAIHEFVALDGSEAGIPSDIAPIEIIHHGYLGEVVRERAKAERNLRLSRAAVERDPTDTFHHYNLAMALVLARDAAGAIAELEVVRERTRVVPRGFRANALVTLAELYASRRDGSANALRAIEEALTVAPTYSNAHFMHGRLLAAAGRLYEARDAFGRAVAAGAHDAEQFVVDNEIAVWKAPCEIGVTLMREKRYDEALRWFVFASERRRGVFPLILNRAKCHEALGELDAAEHLYAGAWLLFADEAAAIEHVNFLLRAERISHALAAIETALPVLSPEYRATFLGTAAAVHAKAGRESDARTAYTRALEAQPRPQAEETLRTLAQRLGEPALVKLFPELAPVRASGLRIAYIPAS